MKKISRKSLRDILIITSITLTLTVLGLEFLMRCLPGYFPISLAMKLPEEARRHVLIHHGLKSASLYRSDNTLYSLQPEARSLHDFPIDDDGYRNPAIPKGSTDVVLLGDSLLIAASVKKDLGTLVRERGMTAYNLGMGGYSMAHYWDVYDRYVLRRGLKHNCVVVMICTANDFTDTDNYQLALQSGKPYLDFMDKAPVTTTDRPWLWTFALIRNWTKEWVQNWQTPPPTEAETVHVQLPYTSFDASQIHLHHLNLNPLYASSIQLGVKSLFRIRDHAPKMAVVLMPSWGAIYSPFLTSDTDLKILFDISYEFYAKSLLVNFSENPEMTLIDARHALSAAAKKDWVTMEPEDYHMNQYGTEVVNELLQPFFATCGEAAP